MSSYVVTKESTDEELGFLPAIPAVASAAGAAGGAGAAVDTGKDIVNTVSSIFGGGRSKCSQEDKQQRQEIEQIVARIRDYFAERSGVHAVYLFGSIVQGQTGPQSDVDVGILYEREHIPDFRQQATHSVELSHQLRKNVDLAILNTASPVLRMQVLKSGELILNQNPKAVRAFFVQTLNEYFDLKRVRREIERNLSQVSIYDRS
jgi:predicted nucleotidyltransferase